MTDSLRRADINDSIDLESLVDVTCVAAVRSGDILALDRIATLPAADRVTHTALVVTKAASADPVTAKALANTGILKRDPAPEGLTALRSISVRERCNTGAHGAALKEI